MLNTCTPTRAVSERRRPPCWSDGLASLIQAMTFPKKHALGRQGNALCLVRSAGSWRCMGPRLFHWKSRVCRQGIFRAATASSAERWRSTSRLTMWKLCASNM